MKCSTCFYCGAQYGAPPARGSGCEIPLHARHVSELSLVVEADWDARLCLTAFDILWANVPEDVLTDIEAQLSDAEREVLQRAADKSVARRISDLPKEESR